MPPFSIAFRRRACRRCGSSTHVRKRPSSSGSASRRATRLEDAGAGANAATPSGDATMLWVQGNRASAEGHAEQAVNLYRHALKVGRKDWPRRAEALEALTARLRELGV